MDIFVRRPVLSLVISLVLLIAGAVAVQKVPVLQLPEIESSSLVITTEYRGASADVVQGFVTEPIERIAMTIPGVDYVDSNTTAGISRVTAWLKLNENSTSALAELTARLNQISYELPDEADDPSIAVERTDRPAAVFYLRLFSNSRLLNYPLLKKLVIASIDHEYRPNFRSHQ
ncbi:efflux RND transporter permease subunit [Endozoicomonas atrinae]|uniref:efflux RND transporter permease subunit n=1 Tax=Endozoicomonas atrinae TaxID=1333660 RepID=UPI003B00595E